MKISYPLSGSFLYLLLSAREQREKREEETKRGRKVRERRGREEEKRNEGPPCFSLGVSVWDEDVLLRHKLLTLAKRLNLKSHQVEHEPDFVMMTSSYPSRVLGSREDDSYRSGC